MSQHFWVAFGLFWIATIPAALLLVAVGLWVDSARSAEEEREEQDAALWADIVAALREDS